MKKLSVIIPCYNEAEGRIPEVAYNRLLKVMKSMENYEYEFIFVNDGSKDDTLLILKELAEKDQNVKVLSFSRNFGHQCAVTAGLKKVTGNACIIIDADMQDPPELIPEMVKLWEEGNDVVYGKRRSRDGESAFKLLTANAFYSFLNYMSDVDIPQNTGDFRLVDRKVVDKMNSLPEHSKFLRGLWAWLGYKQKELEYDRAERFAGTTHYPLKKMLKLASDGIYSFSSKPVKAIGLVGVIFLIFAFVSFCGTIISVIVGGPTFNWFIVSALCFIGGINMFALYLLGNYIIRIYDEAKGRPQFVVDEEIN
ncbi:MAG: glycosyltransferase family 2 protein [Clostridia bacterium]|nr:glycosyltransferase family 2 protein [Clostridia bacterium]